MSEFARIRALAHTPTKQRRVLPGVEKNGRSEVMFTSVLYNVLKVEVSLILFTCVPKQRHSNS